MEVENLHLLIQTRTDVILTQVCTAAQNDLAGFKT